MSMLDKLQELYVETIKDIDVASMMDELEKIRVSTLGKKGPIQSIMSDMRLLSPEEKKEVGKYVNDIKRELTTLIEEKNEEIALQVLNKKIENEKLDITLPGNAGTPVGYSHPLKQVIRDIEGFFATMGYRKVNGPEIEKDYYNFEAVNIGKDHPARDMHDTFYINPEELLRTHTTGVQARTLETAREEDFPIKIISPGKVYRRDDDDATHSHQFTQIEGMYIGENISIADLKGTLQALVDYVFGKGRKIRLRPSYFPFVEPGVEVDVSCASCNGSGCSVCKQTGYIEILGAGMVHPSLLENAGIDSKKYNGFAFGMGPDRITMLKYGVEDIRHFYTNDIRFIKQFTK